MIAFYNAGVATFRTCLAERSDEHVDGFIDTDPSKISWTRALKNELAKGARFEFDAARIVPSLYRAFSKQWLYFDRTFNEMVLADATILSGPGNRGTRICMSGIGSRPAFSA